MCNTIVLWCLKSGRGYCLLTFLAELHMDGDHADDKTLASLIKFHMRCEQWGGLAGKEEWGQEWERMPNPERGQPVEEVPVAKARLLVSGTANSLSAWRQRSQG